MKRKEHGFYVTVTANKALTRREVAREIRHLIGNQCNYLAFAKDAFENEYLSSGLRETPEWRRVRTAAGMAGEPHLTGCPARYRRNSDCICGYTATGRVQA